MSSARQNRLIPCHCAKHGGANIPYHQRVRCHAQQAQRFAQQPRQRPRMQPPVDDAASSDGKQQSRQNTL